MNDMFLMITIFLIALFSCTSYASNVNGFCIVDLNDHCLPPETVTTSDFKCNLQSASISIPLKVDYNAKISDFGLVKLGSSGEDSHVSTRIMGTYGYAAPEILWKSLSMPLAATITIHCVVFETIAIYGPSFPLETTLIVSFLMA
ncbi:hypothetical protein JHK87_001633 [Glycine soja]|nr:hypothetical protein JHK87_001633 [Glycine soja]